MRISSTRITALKRPVKKIQNFFKDSLPRDKELVFEGYELALPEIRYFFSCNGTTYISTAYIDLPLEDLQRLKEPELRPLLINLGIGFVPAHFLLSDFATVRFDCVRLSSSQQELLSEHFKEILTEFRYLQGLDPSRNIRVVSSGSEPLRAVPFPEAERKALMLNGGGKDSCVGGELLKQLGLPFAWLNGFPNDTRRRVMNASGVEENYGIRFFLDEKVRKDAVYPWGVKPYVYAICASSLIVAYLKGFQFLVTGSEHSADDPNLVFKGTPVNHQSGKTYSFERFFNTFCHESVLQDARLFSIARPYTDLRLSEIFSHFPQYFDAFFSCNVAMGTDKWCNACHKCAFTYLAFYPFFEREQLEKIFGAQLFDVPVIRKYIYELATAAIKPWECVGTLEESKLALFLSLKKTPGMEFSEWPRRKDLEAACEGLEVSSAYRSTLQDFLLPNSIPVELADSLRSYTDQLLTVSETRWASILDLAE